MEQCGRLGFNYKELAAVLSVPVEDVQQQFEAEKGSVYEPWLKGRLQVEIEVRSAMLRDALNGSAPMMEKMLRFFQQTEEMHRQLEW